MKHLEVPANPLDTHVQRMDGFKAGNEHGQREEGCDRAASEESQGSGQGRPSDHGDRKQHDPDGASARDGLAEDRELGFSEVHVGWHLSWKG
jgi:hypothetical protein